MPTDDLIDEIVGRLQAASSYEAAIQRAEAAEAKLMTVASILGGAAVTVEP